MADSRANYCLAGVLLMSSSGAWSADTAAENSDAVPDMEFLEYLGSWEDSDADWMLFAGDDDAPAERTEPAPDGEASVENDDEP